MKTSDYIIQRLSKAGVEKIFYMIGGAIAHLVDSTLNVEGIEAVTMHHEQAAAFAAEGYARSTDNKLGVAMATSGPGALNLLTGIGSCYFDSVPTLFITGQVNTYEYKFDQPIRQAGFQETDIVSIVRPICKGAKFITEPEEVIPALEWAINLACFGRPGPVLLDIPMNIQRAEIPLSQMPKTTSQRKNKPFLIMEDLTLKALTMIKNAKRPLVLIGGGIAKADQRNLLRQFIKQTHLPIVSSLMGIDGVDHTETLFLGMIGAYGNRAANLAIANCDLLLVLASRLDTRQTGTCPASFARAAKIIQVDIDPHELGRTTNVELPISSSVDTFLIQCLKFPLKALAIGPWIEKLQLYQRRFPRYRSDSIQVADPNQFFSILSEYLDHDAMIVLDVGQHQMWASQSLILKDKQRLFNSGGMGAMGFALPTAIGVSLAHPNRQVIVIAGDGGIQVNIQELETIRRNQLPIKIVVLDNASLGMVRQFQTIYFKGRVEGTQNGYTRPDFTKVASSYGINAIDIDLVTTSLEKIRQCCEIFLQSSTASWLNVKLPVNIEVHPKLIVNHPIEDQFPFLKESEFKELMLVPPDEKTTKKRFEAESTLT